MTTERTPRRWTSMIGLTLLTLGCTHHVRGAATTATLSPAAALAETQAQEHATTRTLAEMCALLRTERVRVREVARRFGKITGGDGRWGTVEFRPTTPTLGWGMVTRQPRSREPLDIELSLAETAALSLTALRSTLGPGRYEQPSDPIHGVDRFVFADPHPSQHLPLSCTVTAEVSFNGAAWSQALDASAHALGGPRIGGDEPLRWTSLDPDLAERLDGRVRRLILHRDWHRDGRRDWRRERK